MHDLGKSYHEELYIERTLTTPQHYAYLKISEGCDRKCSYCAIPIITGHHISKPMEEILDEVRYLVSQGVKEFQVIAQELTYYGIDRYKKQMLPELIERISDIPGWNGFACIMPIQHISQQIYSGLCANVTMYVNTWTLPFSTSVTIC